MHVATLFFTVNANGMKTFTSEMLCSRYRRRGQIRCYIVRYIAEVTGGGNHYLVQLVTFFSGAPIVAVIAWSL